MFAFEDFIFVMYIDTVDNSYRTYYYKGKDEENIRTEGKASRPAVMVDYIRKYPNEDGTATYNKTYTGIIKLCDELSVDEAYETEKKVIRSVVQFNKYDTPTDPATGQYIKKLLIFPDAVSMYLRIVEADSDPEGWDADDLKTKDMYVLYHFKDKDKDNYYSLSFVENTDDGDENKKTYKRECKRNNVVTTIDHTEDDGTTVYKEVTYDTHFCCDAIKVIVKDFSPWEKETTDENGHTKIETMNIPPDSASHNYYYRNSSTNDIYRWVDDTSDPEKSAWKVSIPPAMPDIKYAAVHLSRLFGVDDDRVYASGYNDYTNWNLDTIDEYNESNAWCSPAQSNTKAGGVFTGIANFQGHIVCFKRDFMHEIYNTKNPFRIQDIYAEGAIDHRTIQDVDGRLIFVSGDDVKIYTGSNPRIIGYYLNMPEYVNAVSGTDGRCYYLYCEDADENKRLFVYDTIAEHWSEQAIYDTVLSFAHNKNGMYMLCDDGYIYKMDSGNYRHSWSFETDLITNETVNIKHIKKIQMFADIASGANIKAYILYDDEEFDEDTSHLVYESTGYGQKPIRVKPRKTASYGIKLHIEGYGYVKLYELELFMENGGDLYV